MTESSSEDSSVVLECYGQVRGEGICALQDANWGRACPKYVTELWKLTGRYVACDVASGFSVGSGTTATDIQ